MRHRFILHNIHQTVLCIDISGLKIPMLIISQEGERASLPALRFQTWTEAEKHLRSLGAQDAALRSAATALQQNNLACLVIL